MKLEDAYRYGERYLEENNVEYAGFAALCTVCYLDGIRNDAYHFLKETNEIDFEAFKILLERIVSGEPLQYVLGKWDFFESEFFVGEGVLIPRPETEELTELCYKYAKTLDAPIIFDLCAGTGCIGISLAKKLKSAKVYCVEKSEKAYRYLLKNAKGVNNVILINDDINNDISLPEADIIISNPPYIKTSELSSLQREVQREPSFALDGGEDGLDFYRIINDKWYSKMKRDALLFLEIGNEQGEDVKEILINFKNIHIKKDLYGNDRMVTAVKR